MTNIEKFDLKSMEIMEGKKEQLKQIFPEVFTEDKIDFEKLKLVLGSDSETAKERYGMTWPGKSDCFKLIQSPSIATLKPARDESIDFDTTENIFIEGENLEVLKLLQKSYYGKIKMIYIDPPYNTGNDFIYKDDYKDNLRNYLEYTGQLDSEGKKFFTNTDTEGRFHTNWLNMMYPRLYLAKNLLRDDGVIFISIGIEEFENIKKICNEIFGEENFISNISRVTKKGGNAGDFFSPSIDYVIIYGRNKDFTKHFKENMDTNSIKKIYKENDEDGPFYWRNFYESALTIERSRNARYFIEAPDGQKIIPPEGHRWRRVEESFIKEKKEGIIKFVKVNNSPFLDENGKSSHWQIYYKLRPKPYVPDNIYIEDAPNLLGTNSLNKLKIPFEFSKPPALIKKLINLCTINEEENYEVIVLDFFAGSCTTAQSVLELNNKGNQKYKFMMVQLPEQTNESSEAYKSGFKTISDIGMERIRRVIKKMKEEIQNKLDLNNNLDIGFKVFKLDKSNFNVWDGDNIQKDKESIQKQLEMHIDHINPSATEDDILYEIILKAGFKLTTKIENLKITGKTVYSIDEGSMLICLDKNLNKELIKEIADKTPGRIVFLDEGFKGNDELKTNAIQTMKSKGIEDFKTI